MQLSRTWLISGAAVTVAVIIAVILTLMLTNNQQPTTATKVADKQSHKQTKKPDKTLPDGMKKLKTYEIGEKVTYTTQTSSVNSAKVAQSVSDGYSSPVFPDKGDEFVIVNLTITNITKQPFSVRPYGLIDSQQRQFLASSDSDSDAYLSLTDSLADETINPGTSKTGNMIYEVPKNDEGLKIGGMVGNTGVGKFVDLKL